ncbi:hypothetical protein FOZ63_027794, partial [Perkinsus olseni]
MVINVGKELLKDADVRVKAERNGWQIVIDKNDTENLQVAFAGVLITTVAVNWNEGVKSYIPRRSGRQRTIRAMNRELQRWASVTAKYVPKLKTYFVEHASYQFTGRSLNGEYQRLMHHISPGDLSFDDMQVYTLGSDQDCVKSIVERARSILEQVEVYKDGSIRRGLGIEFAKNPNYLSPFIINRHLSYHERYGQGHVKIIPNQDPREFNPYIFVSPLFLVWSEKRDQALMHAITFGVPRAEKVPKIPLSTEGLNLVRYTLRNITLSKREMFDTSHVTMMIDVGKELLKDANVRVKAEQDGWNIEIDENDAENVQMAFAEVLTIAVATNWNEE